MEQRHRNAIRKSWTTVIRSLTSDQMTCILDILVERTILTMGMREDIECEHRTTNKVRQLLFIIQKRGPRAFPSLLDSLVSCEANDLATTLMSNIENDASPPMNRRIIEPETIPVIDTESRGSGDAEDRVTCSICMERDISIALSPCGHTLCFNCGDRVLRDNVCCFCRRGVSNTIRIFV